MAYIDAVWIVEVVLKMLVAGQELRNVFHVDAHEAPNESLMEQIAEIFKDWFVSGILGVLSEDTSLYEVTAKDLTTQTGSEVSVTADLPEAGAIVQPAAPNNVALVISWRTLLTGRSYRGRTYIGGHPQESFDGDAYAPTRLAIVVASAEALLLAMAAEGWDLVVTSRANNKQPREHAVSTVINGFIVNAVADSQRRRLTGRGE